MLDSIGSLVLYDGEMIFSNQCYFAGDEAIDRFEFMRSCKIQYFRDMISKLTGLVEEAEAKEPLWDETDVMV